MAEEAHKEPTMEEILSSIRKIISEDDVVTPDVDDDILEVADVSTDSTDAADNDEYDEFTLQDVTDNEDEYSVEAERSRSSVETSVEEDEIFEAVASMADASDDYSAMEAEEVFAEEGLPEPVQFDDEDEFSIEPEVEVVEAATPEETFASVTDDIQSIISSRVEPEAVIEVEPAPEPDTLIDTVTASAAAGALDQLRAKVEIPSGAAVAAPAPVSSVTDQTLETMVRELLRPMIKDWLDANLPGIVEEKVEAEVARIASQPS